MKNQLSALIDGELEIDSADHLIASAKAGGELKQCWAYYHLIGDAMRGDMHTNHGLSSRVMSALESEPTVLAPNRLQERTDAVSAPETILAVSHSGKFWSIAASVAAVMFVGVMVLQLNETEELMPVEIAQSVPTEYLQAHQAAAPNGAAYYIQTASFAEPK